MVSIRKITTESIKLVLVVEQFGASSNLNIPIPTYRKCHFLSFFLYTSSLRHTTKSKPIISNSMLFTLPAAQVMA